MAATSPFASPDEPGQRGAKTRDLPTGTVTLLFTDIEGSTHLLQQIGEHYASMLIESRDLLRAAFGGHHGHEVDTQGDAFFVAFARASDAILASVAAQRALTTHPWPEGVTLRVRMGIHTGEPSLVTEGYVGLDVHYAARIMSTAHGGQVLISQTTRGLVEHDLPDGVSLRDLGEHRLKDLQRPTHLYQLVIADLPADFPPLKSLDSRPNNLPVQLTRFIGREKEVAAVQSLLQREDVRLVTLTGPGGTGKTRLGLQVAAELSDLLADGVYFVNLAPISDPEFVLPTIAQALGIREVAGQSLPERLKEELQLQQMLLVLDNFEQVVSAALQVVDLLVSCQKLKVLVTSRETLRVRAEREFAVPPLGLPDPQHLRDLAALSQYEAVALFTQRAQAVKPDFQMTTANARAVAEICIRLDGLPLAIELAAARSKLLPPHTLLGRLEHPLQVLTSGARDVPARQQTLRSTIEWSYHLLDAVEQRLFWRLSVFVGGCTLDAAEALCDALCEGDGAVLVLDGVASLIDKSLLQQVEQEGKEPRLVMLETIREYGLERLTASGEMEATRQAHAAYYLRFAEEAEPELLGPQQAVWLERLEREHANLRAALRWSHERGEAEHRRETALRLSAALWWFWLVRGHRSEGRAFLEQVLAASEGVVASVRAKVLIVASQFALNQGDMDRAKALAEESLALSQKLGYTWGIGYSFNLLGEFAWMRGNFAEARLLNEEALALQRESGDQEQVTWSLASLAYLASLQGEYTRGRTLVEESLAIHRELGNTRGIADLLLQLAEVLFVSQGDQATVRALLEESLALSRELDDKSGVASCYSLAGRLAFSQGDTAKARSLLEESMVLYRELGYRQGITQSLSLLARVETRQGNYAAASALYEEGLAIGREVGDNLNIAFCLEGLADVVAAQGESAWSAQLWGTAEALREALGTPIPPVYRASYDRSVAAAHAQLGEKAFAAAWAGGRMMTPEQALAAQGKAMIPTPMPSRPASATPVKSPTSPAGL